MPLPKARIRQRARTLVLTWVAAAKTTARINAVANPLNASHPPLLGSTTTTREGRMTGAAACAGAWVPVVGIPQPLQNLDPSSNALPQPEQYAIANPWFWGGLG